MTIKLEAAARLAAGSATMDPQASEALMKKLGYTAKRLVQSAMYEIVFAKDGKEFIVSGWHGKGNYGAGVSLSSLMDSSEGRHWKEHEVVQRRSTSAEDMYMTADEQKKLLADVLAYLKKNA